MTTPHHLYLEACRRGLRLEPAGDKLAVMPKGKCPPDFADTLRAHKAELLAWLSRSPRAWQTVPPSDLPLNLTMPRPSPEDRERVILYLRRQTGDRPFELAGWIVRREHAYYEGPGKKWDDALLVYASCRDAACWQLNRAEREVLDLLGGIGDTAATIRA
jgi:hypothetical protein